VRREALERLPAIRPHPGPLPDIWWIVLDAHGRADVLRRKDYALQTDLGAELARLGFVVVPKARSNYWLTELSLASMLNFELLHELLDVSDPAGTSREPISELLAKSRLPRTLGSLGYRFVHHRSGYSVVDRPLARLAGGPVKVHGPVFPGDVDALLFNATIGTTLSRLIAGQHAPGELLAARYRARLRSGVRLLAQGDGDTRPSFRLVHLLAPHPPFVMRRNDDDPEFRDRTFFLWDRGGARFVMARDEYMEGYAQQADWLARSLVPAVRAILARSATPPVIIVHGDHGPRTDVSFTDIGANEMSDGFGVLLALYVPGLTAAAVPDDLSLVNVPRLVLDRVFGADLPFLENRSYATTESEHYRFVDVTAAAAADLPEPPPSSPPRR